MAEEASWSAQNSESVWCLIAGTLLLVAWIGETWLGLSRPIAVGLFVVSSGFGGYDLVRH